MKDFFGSTVGLFLVGATFAAWLTHVVVCLTHSMWGFLIAGVFFFPVGIIHGLMIWFGFVRY